MTNRRPRFAHSSTRFLSLEDLETASQALRDMARQQRVRVAIVGGYGLAQYGSPRLTGDLDVLISAPLRGLPVVDRLSFGGISTVVQGVPTDLIQRSDGYRALYEAALRAARLRKKTALPVVPLEFLAAMKLAAHREKDLLDLDFILRSGKLNVPETRRIVGYYVGGTFAVAEFNRRLVEAIWKKRNRIE